VLDQIGTVDKTRLVKKLGHLSKLYQEAILAVLTEIFSE
jgi:mRNA-degrading endonuclease toxin of MazEF toxin-antitoxin module